MKAVVITQHGGYDVLKVQQKPVPTIKPGHVKVKVMCAGLNFSDIMARMGLYPDAPGVPCVVGYEVSGVVEEVGDGVTTHVPGNRVVCLSHFGGHVEYVVVPERQAIKMPDNMSFEEGAAIPVNYLTAYHMLFRVGNLRKNSRVLVHMAAGGVGIAALQLSKTVEGVTVLGTASRGKHDLCRQNGCDHPIDYHSVDYAAEVRKITGTGVDIILDPLGGEDNKKNYDLLRPFGSLMLFGVANMVNGETRSLLNLAKQWFKTPSFSGLGLMNDNKAVVGVNMGKGFGDQYQIDILAEELDEIMKLFVAGKVKPIISKVFSFEEAGEAHKYIQERKNVGKVVLVPNKPAASQ